MLDANLNGKEWVAGELSLADFTLASTFVYRAPARISLDGAPHVAAWMARIEARPSWQAATAPVQAFMQG
jgi:glutathione S-transferase